MLLITEESFAESSKVFQNISEPEDKLKAASDNLESFNKKLEDLKVNMVTFEPKN